MNVTRIAKKLKDKGHDNAYQKLNYLKKGAVGMMPKESASFFDDAIAIIAEDSKEDIELLKKQKKEYLKLTPTNK